VFNHLETGGCIRWLSVNEGDRIVLALDVDRPDATVASNTGAWLDGDPPVAVYETISLAEVAQLARAQMPDTSTEAGRRDEVGAGILALTLGALAAALWVEARRRSPPPSLVTFPHALRPDWSTAGPSHRRLGAGSSRRLE
jgi:hypothetical protein